MFSLNNIYVKVHLLRINSGISFTGIQYFHSNLENAILVHHFNVWHSERGWWYLYLNQTLGL